MIYIIEAIVHGITQCHLYKEQWKNFFQISMLLPSSCNGFIFKKKKSGSYKWLNLPFCLDYQEAYSLRRRASL